MAIRFEPIPQAKAPKPGPAPTRKADPAPKPSPEPAPKRASEGKRPAPKTGPGVVVGPRLSPALLARLDAYAEREGMTRTAAALACIVLGLEEAGV